MKAVGIVPFAIPSLFATMQDPEMMKGDPGKDGLKGDTGAAGKNGTDGVNGKDGAAGQSIKGDQGVPGKDGTNGTKGDTGAAGKDGTAGVNAFSAPISRTMSLATAYQATNVTKPAMLTITLESTSTFSLSGSTNNVAQIVMGATNAVAAGIGTAMATYKNVLGGGLVVGVSITSNQANTYTVALPAGWWVAVRQTTGTGLIVSSVLEQVVG